MGNVGYNHLSTGHNFTVCFRYICSLHDGFFSGVCFFQSLPIELLFFDAKKESDNSVLLDWATASEINNDYFAVERSNNGHNFSQLSIIDGAGNSTQRNDYSYTDFVPYAEGNYYQLAQHDYDGKINKSEIRFVSMKQNPVIYVFDIFGRPLYTGEKKNFRPDGSRVFIINENGTFKKYLKPQ
jgi:hypothetical protein